MPTDRALNDQWTLAREDDELWMKPSLRSFVSVVNCTHHSVVDGDHVLDGRTDGREESRPVGVSERADRP